MRIFVFFLTSFYLNLAFATPANSSCWLMLQAPNWLKAHTVEPKNELIADQFIEAIVLSLDAMDEVQKNRFPNMADSMGLNNAAGPEHLIQAASVALDNFSLALPGVRSDESAEAKAKFIKSLKFQWTDKRNILFWGYKAYERFLTRRYNGRRENVDFFMQVLNSDYHVATTKLELNLSLMHVFLERFSQDPTLFETLDFDELVEISFEGLLHFEQKISGLQSPVDLIGGNGDFRADQWRSSTHEGPTLGVQTYKAITDDMDLTPAQEKMVSEKIEVFYAGISAATQLNIMQIRLQ